MEKRMNEMLISIFTAFMAIMFLFFMMVAVKNRGDLLSGLNMMTGEEREVYDIPLISKVAGSLGMFFSISMIVLLNIDDPYKWLGWSMVTVAAAALASFAIISAIGDGKYVMKDR